ncbi:MAG TPA: glycosyltransferase family 4 protein [Solirubrobacteraceae bacterium]|jgi:glycosyltransferase involved in cell wall biosynthesis|nr:glycosyltransferase family 4 protein [Solirubrobacteraceae bacterium]
MKIVLATSIERGGPIEQALLLSKGLARRGKSVLVTCATRELAERFAVDGVRAEVVPLRHQADAVDAARLWRLARGVDVVHAHDRRAGLWTRIGPRPRRGGVRVYTVHGLPEPYHPPPVGQAQPGLRARLLYRQLDARLSARADAVVVPSHAVAEQLVARLGYPAARLCVIPNGIEPPPFVPGEGALIGTLSLLEPVKGIDVFLRAASLLAARHPDWRFVTFGAGSQTLRLAALARELGLGERLSQPGFLAAPEALQQLRVYVLCSYSENAPLALLEAMASGVPAVASAVGGVPEIADESVARMIPAGDHEALASAIERACTDASGTRERVRGARARVERCFTAERNARAIAELYEALLRRRAR